MHRLHCSKIVFCSNHTLGVRGRDSTSAWNRNFTISMTASTASSAQMPILYFSSVLVITAMITPGSSWHPSESMLVNERNGKETALTTL